MNDISKNDFEDEFELEGKIYTYYSLKKAGDIYGETEILPYSLKVILENLLRNFDGESVNEKQISSLLSTNAKSKDSIDLAYSPARVLMQDFTGVPAVVDLAAMRQAVNSFGVDVTKINPLSPVDLVIDHSVSVDNFGTNLAFEKNVELEFSRYKERYSFL